MDVDQEKAVVASSAAADAVVGDTHEGEEGVVIDPELEKRVMRKFDRYFLPQIFVLVLISYLDRSNIGNAKVFGFTEDLHFTGTDFNNISTLFYVTYILFETPCVMCVKRFGAHNVLALCLVCWSIITLCTGFIHNYHQAIAVRLLLGAFEAGLNPALMFVISTIYDRGAQAKRIAVVYGAAAISGAFGGLIAYGIQTMGARRGLAAWRWLFIIEGAISLVVCGLSWLTLPRSAEEAWFLNEEERALMRARKVRHARYKGGDAFEWKYVRMALADPFVYVAAVCLFCSSIPLFGFGTFLPTLILGMGYDSYQANYLTIPVYVVACVSLLALTFSSDRLNKRAIFAFCAPIPVLIGYAIVIGTPNIGAGYFAMFLCAAGIYPYNALLLTWVSTNLKPDHKRAVGLPLFASLANISGLISSQIYPASGGPRYVMGNAVSLATEAVAMLGVGGIYVLLKWRNGRKAAGGMQGGEEDGREGEGDWEYAL